MSAKKLDQSVFDGLPIEYRWAAISETGLVSAYSKKPDLVETAGRLYWTVGLSECKKFINEGYDPTNWKNSLIERQDAPTAADIDWSAAPEGATHYYEDARLWYKKAHDEWFVAGKKGDDWEKSESIGTDDDDLKESELIKRPEPITDLDNMGAVVKPESITDVARSIEAARVVEKSGNRCATCTANICSVIDDCYVQRAKEESEQIESYDDEMKWPDGDARYFETSPVGQKHDASKPRYSLLPTGSVERVIDVLEFGATKYAPNNWQHVSDARTRYYDATMRHLSAWWQGEKYDAESGLHHLAHAACCILFLLWFERSAK